MSNTNLSPDEWRINERLTQLLSAADECPGLDLRQFKKGVADLQKQLLDLPVRREQIKRNFNNPK